MSMSERLRDSLPSVLIGEWVRLLPFLALFVRVAVGLGLLNVGLTGLNAVRPPGNTFGQGGELGGLEALVSVLPYVELGLGLGLILGIFTTLIALLACGLALVLPVVLAVSLIGRAATGGPSYGYGPFGLGGPGFEVMLISMLVAVAGTPCFVILVLLSPRSINRFSVDSLIFQRRAAAPAPLTDDAPAETGPRP